MKRYISILRGINVGGQKKILMPELRKLYETLGFDKVQSYVQSGNVVFETSETDFEILGKKIEQGIQKKFGYHVDTIVRDTNHFKKVIDNNPFQEVSLKDPVLPYVIFFKRKLSNSSIKIIEIPMGEKGKFISRNSEIYIFPTSGYGRTKLNAGFFEKKLGIPATARNWKSVNALYKIALGS